MEEILQQLGVGIRSVNDSFFDDSYKVCKIFQRQGVTIDGEEELCHEVIREFPCSVPGCKTTFQTLLDYEMHYNSLHRYTCIECKVSKPNPRLLDIHIQETHDAFFKILSEKQPMYQCYDSECDMKFNNSEERREHCIKVHKFPKKYRFDNTPHCNKKNDKMDKMKVDNNKSKKNIPHCNKKNESDKMEVDNNKSKKNTPHCNKKNQSDKMEVDNNKSKENTPHSNKENESDKMEVDNSKNKKKINKVVFNKNQNKMFTKAATSPICENNADNAIPATTIKTKTSLAFVPRQVQKSFSKALTNNQYRERNVLESETMMELADSLPD